MTVGELKELLEGVEDDVEITLALQPNYPMTGSLRNVCIERDTTGDASKVWLACSGNEDYGVPKGVWSEYDICPEEDDDEDENEI